MEKVLILSLGIFTLSEILAVSSLFHSDWINTDEKLG